MPVNTPLELRLRTPTLLAPLLSITQHRQTHVSADPNFESQVLETREATRWHSNSRLLLDLKSELMGFDGMHHVNCSEIRGPKGRRRSNQKTSMCALDSACAFPAPLLIRWRLAASRTRHEAGWVTGMPKVALAPFVAVCELASG